ncbi:hypothetical protein SDC9_59098 [bioreactor metagenome]|uniref:Uncharacterized protein n=1 Tax=bioreactor metagenome TaxID=1076179 RepID=A0A644XF14_9ZZZZ
MYFHRLTVFSVGKSKRSYGSRHYGVECRAGLGPLRVFHVENGIGVHYCIRCLARHAQSFVPELVQGGGVFRYPCAFICPIVLSALACQRIPLRLRVFCLSVIFRLFVTFGRFAFLALRRNRAVFSAFNCRFQHCRRIVVFFNFSPIGKKHGKVFAIFRCGFNGLKIHHNLPRGSAAPYQIDSEVLCALNCVKIHRCQLHKPVWILRCERVRNAQRFRRDIRRGILFFRREGRRKHANAQT